MSVQKVMITGAYGLVGHIVFRHLEALSEYQPHGLVRRKQHSARLPVEQMAVIPDDRLAVVDLADADGLRQALTGMDAVVHMAAVPDPDAPWEQLLASNVIGSYNLFEAARLAGVKRVVYASSIMVSFGYRLEEPYEAIFAQRYQGEPDDIPLITAQDVTKPLDLYACSKVWSEALAHTYAYAHGLSCLCIRLGWVVPEDRPRQEKHGPSVWCSHRDAAQIVTRCLAASDDLRFDVFYAVSDNRDRWVDIEHARDMLGYVPQDGAE